ncbi:hypothetical protein GOBAR_AA14638 [Gossypium barbadense]|uniref:Uncharacterized protein n=1 Tax=Gossypium barbadense TaxID=3634 RepID=A0A2P5XRN7_GOSBA|nr:hypothetical protein GOBAR_AA14638 [Gossypium barbadense]
MAETNMVDDELASLNIIEDEEDPLVVIGDKINTGQIYDLCLVGDIDLNRVMDGMPWFFNRHLIILHRLTGDEDLTKVSLWDTAFWVQICNLPIEFVTEGMARQIGNFIGVFLEYDASKDRPGHGESFCPIRLTLGNQQVEFG